MGAFKVHPKYLINHATKVTGKIQSIETPSGTQYATDEDIVLTNMRGDQVIENAELFEHEYVTVTRKIDIDVDAMAQGYMAMAGINKEISNEMLHMENEADVITEKLVTEGKGTKIDYSKLDW